MREPKKINKPYLRQNSFGGWEVADAEPDIPPYARRGYDEAQNRKQKVRSGATVQPATKPQEKTNVAKDPEMPFRTGTKRDMCYRALIRDKGCTLEEAMDLLGWGRSTVRSQFDECAKLSGKKLEKTKEEDEFVYRLV